MENGYVLQISGSLTLYSMTNYTEQTWTENSTTGYRDTMGYLEPQTAPFSVAFPLL